MPTNQDSGDSCPQDPGTSITRVDWVVVVNAITNLDSNHARIQLQLQGHNRAVVMGNVFKHFVLRNLSVTSGTIEQMRDYPTFYDLRVFATGTVANIKALQEFFTLRTILHQSSKPAEVLTGSTQSTAAKPIKVLKVAASAADAIEKMCRCLQPSDLVSNDLGFIKKLSVSLAGRPSGHYLITGEISLGGQTDRERLERRLKSLDRKSSLRVTLAKKSKVGLAPLTTPKQANQAQPEPLSEKSGGNNKTSA